MGKFLSAGFLFLAIAAAAPEILATETGLPYESAMNKLKDSLTGPVAMVIAIVGVCGAGGALIFAQTGFDGFTRTIVIVVLVASLLLCSAQILNVLYGTNAAMI